MPDARKIELDAQNQMLVAQVKVYGLASSIFTMLASHIAEVKERHHIGSTSYLLCQASAAELKMALLIVICERIKWKIVHMKID